MNESEGKFNPFQMNWDDFQNQFKGNSFSDAPYGAILGNKDFSWVEEYVQGILSQAMPKPSEEVGKKSNLQSEVFETHDYMIVKAKVPHMDPRNIKILLYANQLRLNGLPDQGTGVIQLPSFGRLHGCKAVFKKNTLEIRIPKDTNDNFKEIRIHLD
jgi:HSP20 family molecular chaperone IbpA